MTTTSGTWIDLVFYFVAWSSLFILLRFLLFRRFSATFSNVAVSWMHAMVALWLGSKAVDWRHPLSNYDTTTTPEQV